MNAPSYWRQPGRGLAGKKGASGDLCVLGGSQLPGGGGDAGGEGLLSEDGEVGGETWRWCQTFHRLWGQRAARDKQDAPVTFVLQIHKD